MRYIGKEANELDEREAGVQHDLGEILSMYNDPKSNDWQELVRGIPTATLIRALGRDRSTIKRWKAGTSRPRRSEAQSLSVLLVRKP